MVLIVFGLRMAAVSHLKNKKEARMRGKLDKVRRNVAIVTFGVLVFICDTFVINCCTNLS